MLILRVLLNLIMLQRRLPLVLCNARTIFIPKVPGASTASLHRPITVSHVLTRVLHKIYTKRLMAEIPLDLRQRAFIPADGCAENVMLLQTIMNEAKHSLVPLAMASVDVAKAFDRVTHQAIVHGLRCKGVSDEFCDYIADYYSMATTVLGMNGKTLLVHPTRGVRQGDPLSPLLFNLVLDKFLQHQGDAISFRSGGVSASAMAFADDIILTAGTPGGLQSQLDSLHTYLQERGLDVNASKSRTLTIIPSGKEKKAKIVTDRVYTIGGQPIEATTCTATWKYLGIQFQGVHATNDTVRKDLAALLHRLAKAPLKPQQRLVALRFYLIPRLIHRLVLGPTSAKMLLGLDRMIRSAVRHWINLPHDVPLGFLYAPIPVGGLGILCLRTTIPGMRIKRLKSLLHSSHYPCAAAATTETMIKASRQAERMAYFRGEELRNSKASAKYWTKMLHQSFDGTPLRMCTNAPGSTAWLGEGTTFLSGKEFIKLVRFHISAMPTLTRLRRGQDVPVSCRAGCDSRESLGHVLQQCHRTHHQRIERHDGVVRYLASRLKEKGWSVQQEPHYRTSQGVKIPDLVLRRDHQTVILDVQVVGTRVALSEAYNMKRDKYLFPELTRLVSPHSTPIVAAVTMSYRGTWARETVNVLTDVGLGRHDLKMMTIRCLQGGLRAFNVHQRTTAMRPRHSRTG
uniref:Putative tick transposon n=1 Tax=Rhipicephalus pulchellus TaxID=72859 RepID=L7M1A0_RHIPC